MIKIRVLKRDVYTGADYYGLSPRQARWLAVLSYVARWQPLGVRVGWHFLWSVPILSRLWAYLYNEGLREFAELVNLASAEQERRDWVANPA